jgi:hypothetical protein
MTHFNPRGGGEGGEEEDFVVSIQQDSVGDDGGAE